MALPGCDRLGLGTPAAPQFRGADITGATYARSLALPDANGQPRTLGDFKGKVTVVFFGYTQCPDVCPTTMAELAQVKKALGADGDKLQGVFITVDPERDTPEILRSYMASFDPSFVALRGTLEQTQATAKEFKVYFEKVPGKAEGSYTMDHSAGAFVLDTKGNVRLFERYGAGVEALTADIKALIAQG
ncbi:MAG TPA: SCO family protein [Burkholderiaceae bacterium]